MRKLPEGDRSRPALTRCKPVHGRFGVARRASSATFLLTISSLLLSFAMPARPALAYIDPGTSQAIWTTLAPIIGILAMCLAMLLLPFRFAWRRFGSAWKEWPKGVKRGVVLILGLLLVGVGLGIGWVLFGTDGAGDAMPRGDETRPGWKRVVVLGIDGLDPNLLERMMSAGELPNFARLKDEGTFTRLQTSIPPETPVAWLCAATGVNPGRHGVFDFIGRDPKRYLPNLTLFRTNQKGAFSVRSERFLQATNRQRFWDILSDKGVNVSVIRWPITFPPRAVNGRLLSGLGTPDVAGTLGRYHFYTTAALKPDDQAPERVTVVSWSTGGVSTELPGPQVLGFTGTKASAVPLHIERSEDGGSVTIRVDKGDAVALRPGEWSGWLQVEFPGGLSRVCPAAVRMYLTAITPELGLYVSPLQIDPRNPAFPLSYPEDFAGELAKEIGPYYTQGITEDTQAVRHGRIPLTAFLEQCEQITRERELMLEYELDRFEEGLLAFVFDTSDRIQHMFWGLTDPTHPAYTPELESEFATIIPEHYRRMDAVLGKVLQASRDDTAVFVMSDHGFTTFKRAVHLNTWLIQNGFMVLRASDTQEGAPLFKNIDWSKTQAYAVGFCSLYLNVRGREGRGIIAEGEEYRRVREKLSRKLKVWTDPGNGEAVIRNLYASTDVFQGDQVGNAPDLIVGYYPGYRASWQTALGASPAGDAVVDNDGLWSGDHLVDAPTVPGVFLSNIKSQNPNPRLIDIAPTVLRSFNVEAPADMDGKPLF